MELTFVSEHFLIELVGVEASKTVNEREKPVHPVIPSR